MAALEVTSGVMSEACLMDGLHSTDCAIAEDAGLTPEFSQLHSTSPSIIVGKSPTVLRDVRTARALKLSIFFIMYFPGDRERKPQFHVDMLREITSRRE